MSPGSSRRFGPALFGAILLALALQLSAYWPGLMPHDAASQYVQVLSGRYDDWHPPIFAWVWRQLAPLGPGPTPMLLMQVVLYWGGIALFVASALRVGRHGLAAALAACGLMPIAFGLMGSVLKDSMLAATLLAAAGLLAWTRDRVGPPLLAAILLLVFAAMLRFNAFLAALPLLVAALPPATRVTKARLAAAVMLSALPLLLAGPIVNAALHTQKSGVERSLVLFDLGGITEFSGVDVFPPMPIADVVAVNHRCYTPLWWDAYAMWAKPPCPINFESFGAAVAASGESQYRIWATAVAMHPLAYAEHRLAHFNRNIRLFTLRHVSAPAYYQSDPNPWNFHVPESRLRRVAYVMVRVTAYSPLGWPTCWLALAAGIAWLSPRLPSRATIVPLVASALLYGGGYLIFSVASDLRYQLWTMVATLIAAVIAGADIRAGAPVSRRRLGATLAPLATVVAAGVAWRLAAFLLTLP